MAEFAGVEEVVEVAFDADGAAVANGAAWSEVVALDTHSGGLVDVVAGDAASAGGSIGAGHACSHSSSCVAG